MFHGAKKANECQYCGKKNFRHRHDLDDHIRTHTNEKPFVCDICGKEYKRNSHLKRHMRTHTDEKPPYKCDFCQSLKK